MAKPSLSQSALLTRATRSVRWLVTGVAPLGWGLLVGWWTPRGPGTTAEAVTSILVSLAVGGLAGWAGRSRAAMLAAPVFFALAVELVRWPLRGPTVDAPHLTGFGIGALLLGRGVHGLLSLLPLLVGAAYGAGLARRVAPATGRRPVWTWLGRAGVGLLAALVALVTVGVALPAVTAAVPGGIAELTTVRGGGDRELGVLLRGADRRAPVLLFLPGGPGSSEVGAVRRHLPDLERQFVVATVDRRGAARSWAAFPPSSSLTLDSEVADLLAVADRLGQRFGRSDVYLVAHSGGSLVAAVAVQRRPELFRAYVGVGQAVDLRAADRSQYTDTVAWAGRTGRADLVRQLTDLGPPLYPDMYHYEPLLANEAAAFDFDRTGNHEGRGGTGENLGVAEYTLLEKAHVLGGTLDGWDVLYPKVQQVDLRTRVRQLAVPVYLVDGVHEVPGRLALTAQWYAQLQAPHKEHVLLDAAGHRSLFQRPGPFVDLLTRVRAETAGPGQ
ncbi:alpha/beta fold hydrolase [Micromonospora antibiotica]|uniref:Alpha/beta hydrolase n=1 Tax=Micromonospora antibiotica TaxID=2807623 RepID=A0ABS3VEJ2_9ACTN|nr:alpha/beta hydrolase [Micromonospora antibiotica]MBO4164013.1 alpha/beta hydrolase [Micromonospora antibiotica]